MDDEQEIRIEQTIKICSIRTVGEEGRFIRTELPSRFGLRSISLPVAFVKWLKQLLLD